MPKIPYTCFNRVGKDYLSGKAICTETTVTTVMYAEKDCNGKTIVPPNGGPSYYPRGACTKVKDQSFGPGDWFVLATCPNYPTAGPTCDGSAITNANAARTGGDATGGTGAAGATEAAGTTMIFTCTHITGVGVAAATNTYT